MALYQTQPDRKLRAKALAKEYGIGGHSHDYLDGSSGFVNHDGKGLEFDRYPDHQKITLKWAQVEKYIDLMIQSDRYLTDKEKEHYSPPAPVSAKPDGALTHAKNLIREFCQEEYDSEPDFSDLSKIGIAYTHATDEDIPIQVNVDLVGYRVERYLGEVLIDERQYESLEELTETELEALDFSELVSVTDEELEHYHSKVEERPALLPLDAATEYNALKEQHPDALVGFEQNGQFEFYGEDARKVCELVGGKLLEKETELGTVPVTGFPSDQWAHRAKQLWQYGENVYLAGLNEDGTHHQTKYLRREDYLPLGATVHMEGRAFRVDNVNFDKGSVSLQDVALAEMRMPIFREEPLALVRELYEQEQDVMEHPLPDYKVGDNVIVDLPTRTIEGKIGYVGETDVRIDTSAHGQSWDNEVINKQQFEQGLRQSATAQRVDKMLAQAEAIAKESEVPEYERFSVRKVVDGKMPLFAIWDDLYDDYYETNHAVPQFSNEKQAESYLENLKKEVADREAAEWLKVEHAKFLADKDEPEPSDEELDELPISAVMDGKVQTFPDAAALDKARNAEPAPEPAGNFHITDDHLGEGGAKQKYARNIEAIRTLFKLEQEHRGATAEEQQVLSQYVGWGGLADAFDPGKDSWAKEYAELKGLLSEDEYAAARSSTLNAHYTSPTVIRSIYDAVERMGFRSGNILEPSMGVGNFFGMLPDTMQDSRLYGVELDSITGRIAKKLYPQADITVAGFETTDRRDFYDLAVGNVPFGQYKVNDKAYNKLGFSIHNYFFAKAIDQIRPGGVVAFVTSRYTMDSKDSTARKHMAERADLLGAIRLPNNAFRANAGTDVVSDIIFLQKRDRPADIEPAWVQLGKTEDGFAINQYFVDHPDMVLGELTTESTQYGREELTVAPIESANLADQLAEAVQHIEGQYTAAEVDAPDIAEEEATRRTLPADPEVKNFSYTVVDGEVFYRENSVMTQVELSDTAKGRVTGMVELRQIVNELIDQQLNDYPDEDIQATQAKLNAAYDAFTAKYGLLNDRKNGRLFEQDSSYYLLCSLENLDEQGQLKSKAAMFTKRTIRPERTVTSVDTPSEALAVSIGEHGRVDLPYMAELLGTPGEYDRITTELSGVIFKDPAADPTDPEAGWQMADEYLSGDVRAKLRMAQFAAETGTPVSNSMTELYTVMRYLQYSTLQQKKLTHFDCWASTFGETTTAIELAPEGTGYRARTRFAKFFNLPELMSMFKEVADIKTADQLHLPVPEAKFETVVAKPSDLQKEMVQELSKRAAEIHSGTVDASVDNMLCVTNDGRKIGLDVRLMNPMLPDDPNSKLNVCVQNVLKIWEEGKDQKLTQLLFCDLSTPKNDGNFNVYDDIRKKLISAGVPENEIEFIHNADTEAKKAALFSKVRSGDVRVLIGSTAKMGAGTNVQSRLVAVHHLDVGWKPSDMTQRNGRIIRQGNMNKEVKVFNYVTEGTFDSYLYQTLENKQRFISQIMTSKSPVRSCEDVDEQALSYAEIKALCAGNPLIKEKMDLDVQVAKLRVLKADHQSQKFRLQDKLLTKFPADIQETNAHIAGLKADAQLAAAHPQGKEEFCGMTIRGVTYDEKKTAGERLVLACSELPNAEEKVIGSYRGFELSLRFDTFRTEYQALLKGQRKYTVPLGTDPLGNIIRLDNSLNNFPERITAAENELDTLHQQQAAAQIEVEKPFPQEEELAEKSARLAELNAQLDVDEKSHEPEQDEEEQEDTPRRPSVLAALEEKSDKPEPVKPFRSYYDKDGDAR